MINDSKIEFSIIVPTYNRADFLPKTLQSLLNQTFQKFEIIIIDDGSTDNTEEIVKPFIGSNISYYKKKNGERAAARNAGAKIAKGKYINFFDSDDLAYPNHLEVAHSVLEKHPDAAFFHLGYDIKDANGQLEGQVANLTNMNNNLIYGNILSCNGVFLRKDIAIQYPFNEDRGLSASEDWELWLRLSTRYPIICENVITSTVVNHDSRSVLVINKDKLIHRSELLIKYLWEDSLFREKYGHYKKLFIAQTYTYIALHLALTKKHRSHTLMYLLRSLTIKPKISLTRRFWASLKHLI